MLAIISSKQQLTLIENPIPNPAAGQVLAKVAAAGVNRAAK